MCLERLYSAYVEMRIHGILNLCIFNYSPIYYISWLFGVLPFKYNTQLLPTNKQCTGNI